MYVACIYIYIYIYIYCTCYKNDNVLMCVFACACVRACMRACVYVWPTDLFQVTNLALRSKRLPNTELFYSYAVKAEHIVRLLLFQYTSVSYLPNLIMSKNTVNISANIAYCTFQPKTKMACDSNLVTPPPGVFINNQEIMLNLLFLDKNDNTYDAAIWRKNASYSVFSQI